MKALKRNQSTSTSKYCGLVEKKTEKKETFMKITKF